MCPEAVPACGTLHSRDNISTAVTGSRVCPLSNTEHPPEPRLAMHRPALCDLTHPRPPSVPWAVGGCCPRVTHHLPQLRATSDPAAACVAECPLTCAQRSSGFPHAGNATRFPTTPELLKQVLDVAGKPLLEGEGSTTGSLHGNPVQPPSPGWGIHPEGMSPGSSGTLGNIGPSTEVLHVRWEDEGEVRPSERQRGLPRMLRIP